MMKKCITSVEFITENEA